MSEYDDIFDFEFYRQFGRPNEMAQIAAERHIEHTRHALMQLVYDLALERKLSFPHMPSARVLDEIVAEMKR